MGDGRRDSRTGGIDSSCSKGHLCTSPTKAARCPRHSPDGPCARWPARKLGTRSASRKVGKLLGGALLLKSWQRLLDPAARWRRRMRPQIHQLCSNLVCWTLRPVDRAFWGMLVLLMLQGCVKNSRQRGRSPHVSYSCRWDSRHAPTPSLLLWRYRLGLCRRRQTRLIQRLPWAGKFMPILLEMWISTQQKVRHRKSRQQLIWPNGLLQHR